MKERQSLPSTKPNQRFYYGYFVVAAALLIIILHYGARFSFGIFFKPMLTDLDWSRALTSGAFTLSMLFQAIGAPLMGRLNDFLGPRVVMTLCGFLLGIGYLLMSQVSSVWQLYLIYGAVIGLGMGGSFVALLSTVARWFVKRRGIMTGIVISGLGIGTFIMSPVANWLISSYDWRTSYSIIGGAVLVIGILAAQVLRRDPAKVGLMPHGEDNKDKHGAPSGSEGFTLKEAMRTTQFKMVAVIFFSLGYGIMAMNVHLVPHITDLGISAATAAAILAVSGVLNTAACIGLGSYVDRIGSKRVCVISFAMIAVGVFLLVFLKEVWMLYLCAVVWGIGAGGGAPVESTITAELFGMKSHGSIFGAISCCFTIGGALGPFLTGYLFDITGNYQLAFLICAIISAIGLAFSALIKPTKDSR